MKRNVLNFGLIAALVLGIGTAVEAAPPVAPVAWEYDSIHSRVGFSVRHLGVSKVRGEFTQVAAKILAEPASGKVTSVEASVDVSGIDTGVAKRDEHLKGPDFFDAAKFPAMKLKLQKIVWKGDAVSGTVQLTIRDVTRTVAFEGEHLGVRKANMGGGDQLHSGYSLRAVINRQDFGLKFNALAEGVSVVGDQVTIELDVEIVRKL